MVKGVHHEAGAYSTYGRASTGEKNIDRKRKGISDNNDNDDNTGHYGNKSGDKYNTKKYKKNHSGRYVNYNKNKNKNKKQIRELPIHAREMSSVQQRAICYRKPWNTKQQKTKMISTINLTKVRKQSRRIKQIVLYYEDSSCTREGTSPQV